MLSHVSTDTIYVHWILVTTLEINTSGQNYEFKVPVDKLLGYGAINLNFVFISNAKC